MSTTMTADATDGPSAADLEGTVEEFRCGCLPSFLHRIVFAASDVLFQACQGAGPDINFKAATLGGLNAAFPHIFGCTFSDVVEKEFLQPLQTAFTQSRDGLMR